MKRFFFSLIALSAAAIGCTQSALVESSDLFGTEITFSPYTGRTPETKAQSIVGSGGSGDVYGLAEAGGFNVLGFMTKGNTESLYMDKYVDLNSSGVWDYPGIVYWPTTDGGATLAFAAYSSNVYGADGEMDGVEETEGDDLITWTTNNSVFTYEVPTKVNKQVDLLAANYKSGLTLATGSDVELEFKHLLSKVGFKLVSNTVSTTEKPLDIDILIKSVKLIGKFPKSGSVNLKSEDVSISPINNNSTVTYELMDIDTDNEVDGGFIMPTSKTATPIYLSHLIPTSFTESTEYEAHPTATSNANDRYMMIVPHTVTSETADMIEVVYQITGATEKTAQIPLPVGMVFNPAHAYEFVLKVSTLSIGFTVEEYNWTTGEVNDNPYPITPKEEDLQTSVTSTTSTSANIKIAVTADYFSEIGIKYWPVDSEGTPTTVKAQYTANSVSVNTVTLSNLVPNQDYKFIAYGVYGDTGEQASAENGFTTNLVALECVVSEPSPFGATLMAAGMAGNTGTSSIIDYGFIIAKGDVDPVISSTAKRYNNHSHFSYGENEEFTTIVLDLDNDSVYSAVSYATNAAGTVYSSKVKFETQGYIIDTNDPNNNTSGDNSGTTGGGWAEDDTPQENIPEV